MTTFLMTTSIGLALVLGIIIGETYAPISGRTTQKLDERLSVVEGQVQTIDLRSTRTETIASDLWERFKRLSAEH